MKRSPTLTPNGTPHRPVASRLAASLAPAFFVASLALASCAARPQVVAPAGCTSDRDCKLDRICEASKCVWPGSLSAASAPTLTNPNPQGPVSATGTATAMPATFSAQAMFRFGPLHKGRSPFVLPAAAPRVKWKYRAGGPIVSSPAIGADGTIAFGSHDGLVHVVDPLGQARFTFPTGDLIFASPAIDGTGNLFIGSDDDHLYKIDLARGQSAWRIKLGSCRTSRGVGPEASRCDVDGGPTIGPDGTIYVGGDGVFALTPSGELRWHFATQGRVPTAPTLLADGTLIVGGHDDTITAISPAGQKIWDFRTGGDVESTPAVGDDGTIYVGCDDHKVYALSPSGQLQWAFTTGGDVRAAPAVGRNGVVLVGSFDGLLYAINPDGSAAWSFRTGDRILSSVLVDVQGALAFGSQDDRVYALESDGRLRWSAELGGDVDSSPVLGPDGVLYVGSDDRHLYALAPE